VNSKKRGRGNGNSSERILKTKSDFREFMAGILVSWSIFAENRPVFRISLQRPDDPCLNFRILCEESWISGLKFRKTGHDSGIPSLESRISDMNSGIPALDSRILGSEIQDFRPRFPGKRPQFEHARGENPGSL
jgi:hypothetical protein